MVLQISDGQLIACRTSGDTARDGSPVLGH
jgi:hypothetical protein